MDVSYGHAVGLPVNNNKRKRKEGIVKSSLDPNKINANVAAQSIQELCAKIAP
jgi:hypothetical protein